MNVLIRFFFLFLIFFSSLGLVSSFNICNVNFTEPWFDVKDSSNGNELLIVDRDGDIYFQGRDHTLSNLDNSFILNNAHFNGITSKFSSLTQDLVNLPNIQGLLIRNILTNEAKTLFAKNGSIYTKGKSVYQDSQAGCNLDGNYCVGDVLEGRDYFCEINGLKSGFCDMRLISTENCNSRDSNFCIGDDVYFSDWTCQGNSCSLVSSSLVQKCSLNNYWGCSLDGQSKEYHNYSCVSGACSDSITSSEYCTYGCISGSCDICTPKSCSNFDCGSISDGCGGTLWCGSCPSVCGDGVCAVDEICNNCLSDCGTCAAVCGNGIKESGEGCDDGNVIGGDGCDSSCHLESCIPTNSCNSGNCGTIINDGCNHQISCPACNLKVNKPKINYWKANGWLNSPYYVRHVSPNGGTPVNICFSTSYADVCTWCGIDVPCNGCYHWTQHLGNENGKGILPKIGGGCQMVAKNSTTGDKDIAWGYFHFSCATDGKGGIKVDFNDFDSGDMDKTKCCEYSSTDLECPITCYNKFCSGSYNKLTIRNIGGEEYTATCLGDWWGDSRGDNWYSYCEKSPYTRAEVEPYFSNIDSASWSLPQSSQVDWIWQGIYKRDNCHNRKCGRNLDAEDVTSESLVHLKNGCGEEVLAFCTTDWSARTDNYRWESQCKGKNGEGWIDYSGNGYDYKPGQLGIVKEVTDGSVESGTGCVKLHVTSSSGWDYIAICRGSSWDFNASNVDPNQWTSHCNGGAYGGWQKEDGTLY